MIELLVVISIIGILIGLSLIGLQGVRASARDGKRKADLELIRSGLEIYKSECDVYPQTITFGGALTGGTPPPASCVASNVYISLIPKDPLDPSQAYYYSRTTTVTYQLCAALEKGGSDTCTGGCGSGITCNYKVTNP